MKTNKLLSWVLAIGMILSMIPAASAASSEAQQAAETLNSMGLFSGSGIGSDGKPDFHLDNQATRQEAITMLVKLVGGAEESSRGGWDMPFTDVDDWAKNWVGYAYAKGLTAGTSATTFGANDTVTAAQYLTFVLKALGYDASSDFSWDTAWRRSDAIGLTNNEYRADTKFTRGDMAVITRNALLAKTKTEESNLLDDLVAVGAIEQSVATNYKKHPAVAAVNLNSGSHTMGEGHTYDLTAFVSPVGLVDDTVTWTSSDPAVATVSNGKVTGVSGGTAVITATTANGKSGSCTVEIWHSHKLVETVAASCSVAGKEIYTCSGCGHTYDKYLGYSHEWIAESCVEPKTCRLCHATEGQPLGHTNDRNGKCTRCGIVENTPIRIYKARICDMDSVGGIDFRIYWNNHSQKDIKYIRFYVTPYNRVGDAVRCRISGDSTIRCSSTGPYKCVTSKTNWDDDFYYTPTSYVYDPDDESMTLVSSGGKYSYGRINEYKHLASTEYDNVFFSCTWERVWYNFDIDTIAVSKVDIEYMDGSKTTLTGSKLARCMY